MKAPKTLTKKAPPPPAAPAKRFSVAKCGSDKGKKIIIYGDTGMGKTTLSMLAPKPVFIDIDQGADELDHPITGEKADHIPGITTFLDVRTALHQLDLFDNFDTVVIDNITVLQDLAEQYTFDTIFTDKGQKAKNLHSYGYNKGFKHLYDTMRFILIDCDELIRRGKNVILVAQSAPHKISNTGGEDFLRDGPRLHIDKNVNIEAMFCEWVKYILRIGHPESFVDEDKKITGEATRVIYALPELHFRAKFLNGDKPVISFKNKADDSVWQFLFVGGE